MCGIAGIVTSNPRLQQKLPAMVSAIAHRGPDDEGTVYLDRAALGNRRLSIIDLAGGHQPMFNADRTIVVIYNGEIYNFPTLRAEMEREGRRFATQADTEILLHLYEKYGDGCVNHLDGMFAFAIYDTRKRRLLLARDHMGQKPLFFLQTPTAFAFASEVKSLLAADLLDREIDLDGLYHYISLRFLPDRHTLFRGIEKLPAAHLLVFEDGQATISRYWSFSFLDKISGGGHAILDELDARLQRTVQDHTLSDVPVGTFLSGGIDSSLITAMTARHAETSIPTFSIGVKEDRFNELPYARRVAKRYATDHHEEIATADLVRLVPEMVWHMDEPADPFGVGVYLASRLAARHVKVVLSGDGGDELFAGYDRFSGFRLANWMRILPESTRRTTIRRLLDRLPESFAYKGWSQRLRWLNEMSLLQNGDRYAESMSFLRFTEQAKSRLFTEEAKSLLDEVDSRQKILEPFNSPNAEHWVDRMLYTDLTTRMPDHLLPIVDRMAMAHGLEVRPPLLEHRMVEFAARIPSRLKLRGTTLKYALRKIASRYVGRRVVNRPKQGFGFPLAYWLRDQLGGFLRGLTAQSRFIAEGIFEEAMIQELITQHLSGERDHNYRLWILLNLEVWHRLYLGGESPEAVTEWIERETSR
jgi:asparagine synthase (glutamine-hydrolysing)